eukprot:CAMPEP_0180145586 /NCGR_PEP_ID=MMETSP0986-20121125/17800_1 /TAXON_ID=697907 /ORGANISM="non described non described, Strain CCMP2293" /LENGTH=130 /DNA_ID=CAMNT_0022090075 /DNA_START=87 /DNA_END=481 /DNA_ORIENTATION=+
MRPTARAPPRRSRHGTGPNRSQRSQVVTVPTVLTASGRRSPHDQRPPMRVRGLVLGAWTSLGTVPMLLWSAFPDDQRRTGRNGRNVTAAAHAGAGAGRSGHPGWVVTVIRGGSQRSASAHAGAGAGGPAG